MSGLGVYERVVVFYYKKFLVGINDPVVITAQILSQVPLVIYYVLAVRGT